MRSDAVDGSEIPNNHVGWLGKALKPESSKGLIFEPLKPTKKQT